MPKYFGGSNPEISDNILENILRDVDNRTLRLILPQVSKCWQLIMKSEQFHQNILMAILKRITFLRFNRLEDKIEIISSGYTNTNYKIFKVDVCYVLRVPIMKNHILIDRSDERYNSIIAYELGLGAELMYYEKSTGIMVTKYINNRCCLEKQQLTDNGILRLVSNTIKKLHTTSEKILGNWVIFNKISDLYGFIIKNSSFYNKETVEWLMHETNRVKHCVDKLNIKLCPCHNDLSPNNFLCVENNIKIIDWEFSGNNDPIWDLAFLSTVSDLSSADENILLFAYFGEKPADVEYHRFLLYKPIALFWIGLLSLLQIYNCNERLGRHWLAQIAESKFNEAKTLFRLSIELVDNLEQAGKSEEAFRDTSRCLISDPTIPPSMLLVGMQRMYIDRQKLGSTNELKQAVLHLDEESVKSKKPLSNESL